jgi:uncharacterized protein (TIGR03067 family)
LATASADHTAVEANDTRAWQGTWTLVSCISEGESQPADLQWVVEGDQYTIRLDGQSHADPFPFTLDSTQKRIDVHHHDTPAGTYGGHFKGIYAIEGDSLKVCYDLKGQTYPRSFDAPPGSGQVLYEFQRP